VANRLFAGATTDFTHPGRNRASQPPDRPAFAVPFRSSFRED